MNLKKHTDSNGNYYELNEIKNSLTTIFIHGVGLNSNMWSPQINYFKNHSTLTYDLLGHGKTPYKKMYYIMDHQKSIPSVWGTDGRDRPSV